MTGRRPSTREVQFRSRNDEITTWRNFLSEGVITQEQFDNLPGRFQSMDTNEGEDEGEDEDENEDNRGDHVDDEDEDEE